MSHNKDLWDSLDDCLFDVFDDHIGSTIRRSRKFISVLRFKLTIENANIDTYNKVLERLRVFMKINNLKRIQKFEFTGQVNTNNNTGSVNYSVNIKI